MVIFCEGAIFLSFAEGIIFIKKEVDFFFFADFLMGSRYSKNERKSLVKFSV